MPFKDDHSDTPEFMDTAQVYLGGSPEDASMIRVARG